jgi:hypothetical protein
MFRMTIIEGVHAPVFTCDLCNTRITDSTDGIVLYDKDKTVTAHRKCSHSVGADYFYSHELDVVLVWLEDNLKFSQKARKDAEFRARFMEQIG